ncbi:MAG: MBL fold metallo-hydrolase [Thermodesulfobacteriota bacterium]
MLQVDDVGEVKRFRMGRSILGRVMYMTTAYYVDGLLIDSGCAHCRDEFLAALSDLTVEQLANTHAHEDHVGANAALARRFGLRPRTHPRGLPILADPRGRLPLLPYQRIIWGWPEASEGEALPEVVKTKNHILKVVPTPGHSPDHVCFFEPDQGWLFSGDAYVGGKDRTLRADYNVWGIISSLKKMAVLEPKVLFTASGSVRGEARTDLAAKIDYLENLGEKIWNWSQKGLNYEQIASKVLGREQLIRFISQGHFSGKNLVRSFIEDRPH